jgi:NAD(P)-dependent dehydrogenase (short-subunit alcohol dehydrogenase family)
MNVGITYHTDRDGAQDSAREVRDNGADAYVRHLDLTDLPNSSAVIDELAAELGGVDVLVNCSGTAVPVPEPSCARSAPSGT